MNCLLSSSQEPSKCLLDFTCKTFWWMECRCPSPTRRSSLRRARIPSRGSTPPAWAPASAEFISLLGRVLSHTQKPWWSFFSLYLLLVQRSRLGCSCAWCKKWICLTQNPNLFLESKLTEIVYRNRTWKSFLSSSDWSFVYFHAQPRVACLSPPASAVLSPRDCLKEWRNCKYFDQVISHFSH